MLNLKFYRRRRGFSQSALARLAGIGTSSYRQYEYGLMFPSRAAIDKLSTALEEPKLIDEWEAALADRLSPNAL